MSREIFAFDNCSRCGETAPDGIETDDGDWLCLKCQRSLCRQRYRIRPIYRSGPTGAEVCNELRPGVEPVGWYKDRVQ